MGPAGGPAARSTVAMYDGVKLRKLHRKTSEADCGNSLVAPSVKSLDGEFRAHHNSPFLCRRLFMWLNYNA